MRELPFFRTAMVEVIQQTIVSARHRVPGVRIPAAADTVPLSGAAGASPGEVSGSAAVFLIKRLPQRLLTKRITRSAAEPNKVAVISLVRRFLFSQIDVKDHLPPSSTGRKQNSRKSAVHASESSVPRVKAVLSSSSSTSAVIQAHRRMGM